MKSIDGYDYPEEMQKLFYILANGPDIGVHTICWIDTVRSANGMLRQHRAEFGLRVAFQMSADDSSDLIDSTEANRLGIYKGILYDEENSGDLEKFRPYALPSKSWLEWAGRMLKKRINREGGYLRGQSGETRDSKVVQLKVGGV